MGISNSGGIGWVMTDKKLVYVTAMTAGEYYRKLSEKIEARDDLVYSMLPLKYQAGEWEVMRIVSKKIGPVDKLMVIRGTIHGDEIAGALTILNYFDELVNYAHGKGIKLIIYPLANPSGFEKGRRYNVDNDKGQGNNDFIRYRLTDGSIGEVDLGPEDAFSEWLFSDDPSLAIHLPEETRLFQKVIRQDPLDQVVAAIDLHQDFITPELPPYAYHYAYGDLSVLRPIARRVAEVVPVLAHFDMNAGFGEQIDENGKVVPRTGGSGFLSDEDGFIVRHDATFSDFFYRRGAKYSVTTETSGATPMEKACEVNWIWIEGLIDLAAKS